jgi:co-chaperonin GroES (HSP10)
MNPTSFEPFGKRVVVKKMVRREGETFAPEGSILMPEQIKKKPPAIGWVIRRGDGCETAIAEGDKVMYARHAGQPVGDTEHLILFEEDILGRFNNDDKD